MAEKDIAQVTEKTTTPSPSLERREDAALCYFEQRMKLLGITEAENMVKIHRTATDGPDQGKDVLVDFPVFKQTEKGIEILVYTLDRMLIPYAKEGSRWKHQHYAITRLEKPIEKKDSKGNVTGTIKYLIPKGQGSYPHFHPMLIEKFEQKQHIETLFITEGFFKSWKGCMHGLDVVGVSSITHLRDKQTNGLHPDILKLVKACTVKRVVWLTDGDCRNITSKDLKDGVDLYKRPNGFFSSGNVFQQLLNDYEVERWFAHIDSDNISGNPKGLDDLYCALPGKEAEITADLNAFSKPGQFAVKLDITFNIFRLKTYFNLDNVDHFISHHIGKGREELKNIEFFFNGTRYKWDNDKAECKMVVPGEAKNYFRVGDQYHEFVPIPNKYGETEMTFHRRQKGTLIDDYGKTFPGHVPKYKAFCNVPDHVNFQQVINNCFNIYGPFEHEQAEEDCTEDDIPHTLGFFKHIFGTQRVKWMNPKTKEEREFFEYDLGLDYVQLLYQKPTQILPILCLVSRENNTGKSTFGHWLKAVFTANCTIVGNAELADNFNASWASKLCIICDEAKIDKMVVVEKVKALSTAKKILMNAKGKDHVEIDFFGKFIFNTNNEENFIYASEDDVRYWVRKVPVIDKAKLNINLLDDMINEIPSFLAYLNKRKMATDNVHRAWFDPALIRTEALKKVIAYSQPTIEKELRQHIRDKFMDFGIDVLMMTRNAIHQDFFRGTKYEVGYLEKVLKERLHADLYHYYVLDGKEFKMENDSDTVRPLDRAREYAKMQHGNADVADLQAEKKYVGHRHQYPRWETKVKDGGSEIERTRVEIKDNGRPYVFYREDFLTKDEMHIRMDAEMEQVFGKDKTAQANGGVVVGENAGGQQEHLPF